MVHSTAIASVEPTAIGAVSSRILDCELHSYSGEKSALLYMNGCNCTLRRYRVPVSPGILAESGSGPICTTASEQENELPTGVGNWFASMVTLKVDPKKKDRPILARI